MIEQTYYLDMIPSESASPVVHVSQYDTNSRKLSFELYNEGVAYQIPTGAVASIAGTKPDGYAFLYQMSVSGNVVSIDIEQQMALIAGDVPCEIQITGNGGKIGSANFILRVERGPIDEDSVISDTDLPIFEQLVSDAQAAAQEANESAQTAVEASEAVSAILPASAGSAGQILTRTSNGADWQTLDLSGKANTSTLATVEGSSKASRTYAVGDYLVYNGILYRVTAAISTGRTLTPGTNISATNAGAELTALNNGLTNLLKSGTPLTCTSGHIVSGKYYELGNAVFVQGTFVVKNAGADDVVLNIPSLATVAFSGRDTSNGNLITMWAQSKTVSTYLHTGTVTVGNAIAFQFIGIKA